MYSPIGTEIQGHESPNGEVKKRPKKSKASVCWEAGNWCLDNLALFSIFSPQNPTEMLSQKNSTHIPRHMVVKVIRAHYNIWNKILGTPGVVVGSCLISGKPNDVEFVGSRRGNTMWLIGPFQHKSSPHTLITQDSKFPHDIFNVASASELFIPFVSFVSVFFE